MGRGGRSSGGGFRRASSYSAARRHAPPPAAAPKPAAAPAPTPAASSPAAGYVGATISDGCMWGFGSAIGHRIMDAVWGPRKFEVEHTTNQQAVAAPAASSACLVHALDFQDCVSQNSSDISKCKRLVDILNDCRRRSAPAVVEASG